LRGALTTHAFRIGGLQYEAHDTFEKDVERFCQGFESRIVGIRDPAHAKPHLDWADEGPWDSDRGRLSLPVTGPVRRASGVKWDISQGHALPRRTINTNSKFLSAQPETRTIGTCSHGRDAGNRGLICLQAMQNIPTGPIMAKVGKVLSRRRGEALSRGLKPAQG